MNISSHFWAVFKLEWVKVDHLNKTATKECIKYVNTYVSSHTSQGYCPLITVN